MALFQNLQLTNAGNKVINDYILGTSKTPISITAIAIGDGQAPATPAAQTALVHELKRLAVESTNLDKGVLTVTARLSTDTITADITHREIGLYSGTTLIAYANSGNDYDFIPAAGQNTAVIKVITVRLTVGTVAVRLETLPTDDYVTYDGLVQRVSDQVDETAPDLVRKSFQEIVDSGKWNEDIKAAVTEALNEGSVKMYTTPEGTEHHTVKWAHVDKRHSEVGRLAYITLDTKNQATSREKYRLMVWEQDEVGGWSFLALSNNEANFESGQPKHFTFRGVELHGRAFRFAIVSGETKEWNESSFVAFELACSARTAGDTTVIHGTAQNYNLVPAFTLGYCSPKCAPYSHLADAVSHLSEEEHTALTELLENGPSEDLTQAVETLQTDLTTHTQSTEAHVQAGERAAWNAKLDAAALTVDAELQLDVTSEAGSDAMGRYIQLDARYVPTGQLTSISITCRKGANSTLATTPVFLGLWEEQTPGSTDYARLAASTDSQTQALGESRTWSFSGVSLRGHALRICFLASAEALWPSSSEWKVMGLSVVTRAGDDSNSCIMGSNGVRSNYIPHLSFSYVAPVEKFAPREHVTDETVHINAEEKQALHNLVENPPTAGAKGDTGPYFTPSVSSDGVLSWTNNGNLPNPPSVTIKGATGPAGPAGPAGEDGEPGAAGAPGKDGAKGDKGEDGKSAFQIWLDLGNHGDESDFIASLKGEKGDDGGEGGGTPGKDGVTFTPSVSEEGLLSWTNDGELENPKSVNIKGADGATGPAGPSGPAGPAGPAGTAGKDGKDAELTEAQTEALQFVQDNQTGLQGLLDSRVTLPEGNNLTQPVLGSKAVAKNSYSVVIGNDATESISSKPSVVIGKGANGSGVVIGTNSKSSSGSLVVGEETNNQSNGCVFIGHRIKSTGYSYTSHNSVVVGTCASIAGTAIAIGAGVNVEGLSSTVIGLSGSTKEDKVLVLCAGDYGYNFYDGSDAYSRTQLYLIAAGSTLSSQYLDGEAGLGYCVQEGERIVASGCVKLSAICTVTPFEPENGQPIFNPY